MPAPLLDIGFTRQQAFLMAELAKSEYARLDASVEKLGREDLNRQRILTGILTKLLARIGP